VRKGTKKFFKNERLQKGVANKETNKKMRRLSENKQKNY